MQSQWWSAEELLAHQYRQLAALLRHARATVPFYRKRLEDAGLTDEQALTPEGWLRIPLLTRRGCGAQGSLISAANWSRT
jgi:phenylacetate-CoA ligase